MRTEIMKKKNLRTRANFICYNPYITTLLYRVLTNSQIITQIQVFRASGHKQKCKNKLQAGKQRAGQVITGRITRNKCNNEDFIVWELLTKQPKLDYG